MQGEETARESVLKKFNSKAYNLSRDDVYLTAGGTMSIWATMQLLAGKGDNFLFPSPGFPLALAIAKMMGL
jgi:aspartate/methionine/tyrosine aminotransferase